MSVWTVRSGGLVLALTVCATALAQSPVDAVPEDLDTVLVLGEQPGPGLWKVSNGSNVMWVLGQHGPLPQGVHWRAAQVEARVAESQLVLYPGSSGFGVDIGILHGLTLIPGALRAGKIPDGKRLKDVLPPATYAKWRALREQYYGKDDDIERWRPAIALEMLREKMQMSRNGRGGVGAQWVVNEAAKRHNVPIRRLRTVNKTLRVERPRSMLKAVRKLGTPEVQCFTRKLDEMQSGIDNQRTIANAWAQGNIDALRRLHAGPRAPLDLPDEFDCSLMLMDALESGDSAGAKRARKLLDDIRWHTEQSMAQVGRDWINAARESLEQNASTFTVLPIREVVREDGLLWKLRGLGYEIEEPL